MLNIKKYLILLFINILMLQVLSGCATYHDIQMVRDIPGITHESEYDQAYYDKSVIAYRYKDINDKKGKVVRDSYGKKIRTEKELSLIKYARTSEINAETKKTLTFLALGVIYFPIGVVMEITESIVGAPISFSIWIYKKKLLKKTESSYSKGREYFEKKEYSKSLEYFEHAIYLMPSLKVESDIDYWRGKSFEQIGEINKAKYSYTVFIEYSERENPEFFTKDYSQKSTWLSKAKEVQPKLLELKLDSN